MYCPIPFWCHWISWCAQAYIAHDWSNLYIWQCVRCGYYAQSQLHHPGYFHSWQSWALGWHSGLFSAGEPLKSVTFYRFHDFFKHIPSLVTSLHRHDTAVSLFEAHNSAVKILIEKRPPWRGGTQSWDQTCHVYGNIMWLIRLKCWPHTSWSITVLLTFNMQA